MEIGFPNNPKNDLEKEIEWTASNGFGYLDLYLEEGRTAPDKINPEKIKNLLNRHGFVRKSHMPWYIPIGSPIKTIRDAAVAETERYFKVFAYLGIEWTTLHTHWCKGSFNLRDMLNFQTETLGKIVRKAKEYNIKIMLEPADAEEDSVENVKTMLESVKDLHFLLDTGHANLWGRKPVDYIAALHRYLAHVHIHDNYRNLDLHLPIGCGSIDWENTVKNLKYYYDGTITLEIFSRHRDMVTMSRDKLLHYWKKF